MKHPVMRLFQVADERKLKANMSWWGHWAEPPMGGEQSCSGNLTGAAELTMG
jgi:hypothetical protein